MPSICLCLTFYKDNSPQRAVQMENSANDWLLCRLFSKLRKPCQNATFSTKDGRQLPTIHLTLPEALDHGCAFDMWLLMPCTSDSQEIRSLSCHPEITLNFGLHKFRSTKSQATSRLTPHSRKSTIFIPLAAITVSNLPQRCYCPRTTIPASNFKP